MDFTERVLPIGTVPRLAPALLLQSSPHTPCGASIRRAHLDRSDKERARGRSPPGSFTFESDADQAGVGVGVGAAAGGEAGRAFTPSQIFEIITSMTMKLISAGRTNTPRKQRTT